MKKREITFKYDYVEAKLEVFMLSNLDDILTMSLGNVVDPLEENEMGVEFE